MSYSRWIGSTWYTFWSAQSDETENRDTAVFEICAVCSFTAKELRNDMDKCISIVKRLQENVEETELDELRIYMFRFLKDVNDEYPEEN